MKHSDTHNRWKKILFGSVLVVAVLMQIPQLTHRFHPDSQDMLVQLNSDEYYYMPRVMEALSGRSYMAAEAITGDKSIIPLQGAFIESVYGLLFGWTGLRADAVLQLMDSIIPATLFLVMWWFFVLSGFSRTHALIGTVLFFILELYNLGRPIHQRASFLMVLLAMNLTIVGMSRTWLLGVVGGMMMGVLVGVYFWSWTFVWAWWGIVLGWELIEWLHTKHHDSSLKKWWHALTDGVKHFIPHKHGLHEYQDRFTHWQWALIFGGVGLIFAYPAISHIVSISSHPLYEIAQERNEFIFSRAPESLVRSGLFAGMCLGLLVALYFYYRQLQKYKYAVAVVLAACVVLNQQIVHGIILQFSSHYLFPLVFAGVVCLMLTVQHGSKWLYISLTCSAIFLGGIAYDARYVFSQFVPQDSRFTEQHLVSARKVLEKYPRSNILSDEQSSLFIAGHTHHNVMYSPYLKHALFSNEELQRRKCFVHIFDEQRSSECSKVLGVLPESIREESIQYILWDEKRFPNWNTQRLGLELEQVNGARGWSLWQVPFL